MFEELSLFIEDVAIHPFARSGHGPPNVRTGPSERRGYFVRFSGLRDHEYGIGEAAPLPGYTPDSANRAKKALENFAASTPRTVGLGELGTVRRASPAAAFALETAFVDMLGRLGGKPSFRILRGEKKEPPAIPVAHLIVASHPREIPTLVSRAAASGASCIKVKIGRPGFFDQEMKALALVRQEIDLPLRLDANQGLSDMDPSAVLYSLAHVDPEFVEEPFSFAQLKGLAESPVGIALDESLQDEQIVAQLDRVSRTVTHCVLKPTALGGIVRCLQLARLVRSLGIEPVVSHTFEGRLGLAAARATALAIAEDGQTTAAGLGDYEGLPTEGCTDPHLRDGRLVSHEFSGLGIDGLPAAWCA